MNDLALVIPTVDRSPGTNYLADTVRNLIRGGLLDSPRLRSSHLVDSGPGDGWTRSVAPFFPIVPGPAGRSRCGNENIAEALRVGAKQGARWVLYIEDDVDVCARFFDSAGAWLDDHAEERFRVYALGSPYPDRGETSALFPVDGFFGTQAMALRSEDAADLADWLANDYLARGGAQWDLLMHDWARDRWPELDFFLAAVPSMVQHIGKDSSVEPRASVHTFPSWPGREWSYEGSPA